MPVLPKVAVLPAGSNGTHELWYLWQLGLRISEKELPMIGRTLGRFRLVAKLGEGGMGVVYRAKDLSLGREVAVKVLPEALAADEHRMTRFEREARLLASLSHPQIAAAYEVGQEGETRFLVMELVPGETLAELRRYLREPRS